MTDAAPVVLVTGGARRIGARIAQEFHARGFRLVVHYHQSGPQAQRLVDVLNSRQPDSARAVQAALTRQDVVPRLASAVLACFGRLDVLVNNASGFYPTPIPKVSQQQWDELIDSNLRGAFFLSCALAPELTRRAGAIVNLVDIHGDQPLANHPIYSIAKAGLQAMTRSLALELAPRVRVNGVSPGAILWPAALANADDPAVRQARDNVLAGIPAGRLGDPGDIARTVCFLARQATYLTGAVVKVDGGRSLMQAGC